MVHSKRSLILAGLATMILFSTMGCATTSEISSLRQEVSRLRSDVQIARQAAESSAADASRASEAANLAALRAASAETAATLANEKAERVYVRALGK